MGRRYAGILGPLAMLVMIVRGLKNSAYLDGTLWIAIVMLFVFSAVGFIVGVIAEWTVDQSVRTKIEIALAQINDETTTNV